MTGPNYLQGLRRRRFAAFVGIYALVLEFLFGSIHAAALAASALGASADPDSFVFQICTPAGLTSVRMKDAGASENAPASRNAAADYCPVCASAAVSLFTWAAPATVPPAPRAVFSHLTPEERAGRSLTAWRSVRIRAPPSF